MPELVCSTLEEFVSRAVELATTGRAQLADYRKRILANRDTSTLFDVAELARGLEGLYRQMRDEYLAGEMPDPRLSNLDSYFEIGVTQDHEAREMAALLDYEGFYRSLLARRYLQQAMDPDGRLWTGGIETDAKPAVRKPGRKAA